MLLPKVLYPISLTHCNHCLYEIVFRGRPWHNLKSRYRGFNLRRQVFYGTSQSFQPVIERKQLWIPPWKSRSCLPHTWWLLIFFVVVCVAGCVLFEKCVEEGDALAELANLRQRIFSRSWQIWGRGCTLAGARQGMHSSNRKEDTDKDKMFSDKIINVWTNGTID